MSTNFFTGETISDDDDLTPECLWSDPEEIYEKPVKSNKPTSPLVPTRCFLTFGTWTQSNLEELADVACSDHKHSLCLYRHFDFDNFIKTPQLENSDMVDEWRMVHWGTTTNPDRAVLTRFWGQTPPLLISPTGEGMWVWQLKFITIGFPKPLLDYIAKNYRVGISGLYIHKDSNYPSTYCSLPQLDPFFGWKQEIDYNTAFNQENSIGHHRKIY